MIKYTIDIEINKPIAEVLVQFNNSDNLSNWMEGLVSFEHVSGEARQPGAKSKLVFNMGKRTIEMIETITVRNLPHEFSGTYEVKGVCNRVKHHFIPLSETITKQVTEHEFQFKGFMKTVGFVMPGSFKNQSIKHLQDFKKFVESI
jgi:hypothetical protein